MEHTKTNYIREFDYIRVFSIFCILLFHYTTKYSESVSNLNWSISFPEGAWAVNTLFVLTGYLSLRNFSQNAFKFLYKRFIRLYPAYFICIIVTSLFMLVLMPEKLCSFKDIILNFTMFPTYLGAKAVDGAYWTLPIEIIFYFILAYMMSKKSIKRFLFLFYLWIIMSVSVSILAAFCINNFIIKLLRILLVTERGHCFVIGCIIALIEKGIRIETLIPAFLLACINSFINMGWKVTIWTISFALLIYFIACNKIKFALRKNSIIDRFVSFVAKISYPMYLLHQYIGFSIIFTLEKQGVHQQWIILLPIIITITISAIVHYTIERTATRLFLHNPSRN